MKTCKMHCCKQNDASERMKLVQALATHYNPHHFHLFRTTRIVILVLLHWPDQSNIIREE